MLRSPNYAVTATLLRNKCATTFAPPIHVGDLEGTDKTSTWTGVHTDCYEGGKLVESWVDWDKYSFLEGLGLVG